MAVVNVRVWKTVDTQARGGLWPDEVLAGVAIQVLPCFHGHHFIHKISWLPETVPRAKSWEMMRTIALEHSEQTHCCLFLRVYNKLKGSFILQILLVLAFDWNNSHEIHYFVVSLFSWYAICFNAFNTLLYNLKALLRSHYSCPLFIGWKGCLIC